MKPTRIRVGGKAGYDVVIGAGLSAEVSALPAGPLAGARQVMIVHQPPVLTLALTVARELADAGVQASLFELPDGEAAKTAEIAAQCWGRLGELGLTRSDAIVGVGGGAATDLAGWVAASWLRGIKVVQVPTTLAGMVDAAVGGKTGINTERGKNLVGAFHPPAAVLCDLNALATLPLAEYRAGLAEVVKTGFIADPVILELIEADPAAAAQPASSVEAELIERSVRVKAAAVTEDLTEQGVRIILNYGHTLAHAIERAENYTWRHGDAVSVGLVYAAALGRRLGRLDDDTADRHGAILRALSLPTTYDAGAFAALLATMSVDKKARGTTLRFVILDGLARPAVVADPDPAALLGAYSEVASAARESR
jgi:3-dehydroquinate synthase